MVSVSPWVKVLLPVGITLATVLGGASWHVAVSNEHRLTEVEAHQSWLDARADDENVRQTRLETLLTRLGEGMARVEGALTERNRTESLGHKP